jgi:hypothetical protein
VHAEDIAAGTIEPGQKDGLIAGTEIPETLEHLRLEDEPGFGRALVGLPGRRLEIGQRRHDSADRPEFEIGHVRLSGSPRVRSGHIDGVSFVTATTARNPGT